MQQLYTSRLSGNFLMAGLLVFSVLWSVSLSAQQSVTGTIMHDGIERDYRLRLPLNTDGERPLIFNLHGAGSSAIEQEFYAVMNPIAEEENFYVCYANGVDRVWNVGWEGGSTADDVGFINALIDTLAANYDIDLTRVYSCGMSNGGFMSYRLACELNDRIAAVASVTGAIAPLYYDQCEPGRAVPALQIHGTEDSTVIYGGRPGINVSIDSVMLFWQTNNSCDSEPIVEELPDTDPDDESTVTKFTYQNCEDGLEVQLLRVNGGAHTWPGATFAFDVTNQDINASQEIWDFFKRFSLDEVTNTTTAVAPTLVEVFPNPTTGLLQIQTTSAVSVQLFDGFGQRILQEQNLSRPSIDISALPAGLYVLQVLAEGGQLQNFKVVKR